MVEIAMTDQSKGIFQKDISTNQNISFKYLDQIISGLKSAGLINLIAGKKSGYVLSKAKSQISVYDIYKAFNPDVCIADCIKKSNREQLPSGATEEFWTEMNELIIEKFKTTSLATLTDRQEALNSKEEGLMYYI